MRLTFALAAAALLGAPSLADDIPAPAPAPAAFANPAPETAENAFAFGFTGIDGGLLPLSAFEGQVLLVVNTASFCGFTGHYERLQAFSAKYKAQGLVVIGAPSNQFGNQEPKSEAEIKEFCETKFAIDFPLTAKVEVKGEGAHPFYQWAKRQDPATEPSWNFHRILIGRDGKLMRTYSAADADGRTALFKGRLNAVAWETEVIEAALAAVPQADAAIASAPTP